MPTYEYECQSCHQPLEAVQKFTDAPLVICPLCQGELRKVYSAVGIVFKGSGFYKNDSRGAKSTATPTSSATSEPSAPTPDTSKTPSTPTPAAASTSAGASTSSSSTSD
ncbi:MAG: FmdB family zinc ribbon protein [Acidimicrobiales bacterium]